MRVAGYVRVSREEQLQGYSPAAQSDAIRRECNHCGHVLVAEFRDEGRSARLDSLENRPGFQAAIEAVQSGIADAIIVHKVDRAARNLRVFLQVMTAVDGRLISIIEHIDYASAHGRLVAHVLGSVAQYFSDNLATEIRKGMDERKRQGLWNGPMPFGARKQDEHGKLPPVPDREPFLSTLADHREWSRFDALQLIFNRAAGGGALSEIVEELQRIGFNLTATGIGHLLMNRFYLGELSLGRHRSRGGAEAWVQGAHEPLIDQATFDDAQRIRIEREGRRQSGRPAVPIYAVSGLVRCGGCNGPVMCRKDSTGKIRLYCRNRYERRNCDQPSCKFEAVEVQIFHALNEYTPSSEIAERIADVLGSEQPDIEAQRERIAEQRKRLRELYVLGEIPLTEYRERTNELERALMALPASQTGPDTRVVINFLQDLPAAYRAATDQQRNDLLRRVFVELMVKDKQLVAVRPRPALDRIMRANLSQVLSELSTES